MDKKNNEKSGTQSEKCIVLDTNIWVYHTKLLRSPIGVALLYVINSTQAYIGIPEVVELEIIKHTVKTGLDAVDKIKKAYSTIEILVGKRDDYRIPSEDDLRQIAMDRIKEFDSKLIRVSLTLEHAQGALQRIMGETPPNGEKNQQFKDSCIWEAVLELSKLYEVHFITDDRGFFEDRQPSKGIAKALKEEIDGNTNVHIYNDIKSFLEEIKQTLPSFDKDKVINLIHIELCTLYPDDLASATLINDDIKVFLTEKENTLAVDFTLEFDSIINYQDMQIQGKIKVEGDCFVNQDTACVEKLQMKSKIFYDLSGKTMKSDVFIYATDAFGRQMIPYTIRVPLDGFE